MGLGIHSELARWMWKAVVVGFTCLVVGIAGAFGYIQWLNSGALFKWKTFDRVEWLKGGDIRDPSVCLPGAYMAHDIVTRVIKPGMPLSEVLALLGGHDFGESKIAYTLGLCVGSAPSSIIIWLDESRTVAKAELLP